MALNEPGSRLRLTFLSVVVIAMFVALFSRLWFLQILAGDRYAELAETNRVRQVVTEAPRGDILTADGSELVENRPALTISAERQRLLDDAGNPVDERAEQVLGRLSDLLDLEVGEIVDRLSTRRYSPFRPVPIAFDVAPEIVYAVGENRELFPGVVPETLPVRTYPQGQLAAHLVGYLGEISEEELASEAFADAGYRAGDQVGRGGLEQVYERHLQGRHGVTRYEVNAQSTVLDVISDREPVQGNHLQTSLDLDLQQATEQLLAEGIEASRSLTHQASGRSLPSTGGSAVVLDPADGSVLAMASYPTFDPREFVGGIDQEYWDELRAEGNHNPLLNRPVQSAFPPGSVFKPVTGAAYMEAGVSGPHTQVDCDPAYEIGQQRFRNWNTADEGPMSLSTALMRSCDTYFYELAHRQWQREEQAAQDGEPDEVLPPVGERFGFGRTLGIDLPYEVSGTIPGREWKRNYWEQTREVTCRNAEETEDDYQRRLYEDLCQRGHIWRPGDAVNASIGQGDILATPLQVASSYVAIANGGTLFKPQIGEAILSPAGEVVEEIAPEPLNQLELEDAELAAIRSGLRQVVTAPRGTANAAFSGFPLDEIPVAGKTGTAEMKPKVPFAWFAAYAPADDPEVVVVVNVEEGGGGSQTAAPIARNILEQHFEVSDTDEIGFEAGPEYND